MPPYGAEDGPRRADRLIQALASRQHGIVTRAELAAAGLSKRAIEGRIEAGWLVRLHRGVYAVGHMALTRRSRLVAAVYACGTHALASHRAPGLLWGILRGDQPNEVTAPRTRGPCSGIVVHTSRHIHPEDRALIDAIPVSSLARTLVDLADVLSEERLGDAVNEAEIQRRFDRKAIDRVLDGLPGRKGSHKLMRVLAAYRDVQPFIRSRAERLVLKMCTDHGLPTPRVNIAVAGYEVDFHWPDANLVLEADGEAVHRTRRAFHQDRRRDRALAARGIHVVRATWRDLTEGEAALADELRKILAVRRRR